jgi:hypothetical protein
MVVVGGAAVDFARRATTMIIIGIILSFVGLAYLCWLLFALAVYALPFFAGLTAGLAAYHSGSERSLLPRSPVPSLSFSDR